MTAARASYPAPDLLRPTLAGLAVLLALAGGLAAWATLVPLSDALVLHGAIAPARPARALSHAGGGQVAAVLVQEGERVRAGQPLIALETRELRARARILRLRLDEMAIRAARLNAERAGRKALNLPTDLAALPQAGRERRYFALRAAGLRAERASLLRRIASLGDEIGGYRAQRTALDRQRGRVRAELDALRRLQRRGLVQTTRILALEQTVAELDSDLGALRAQIAHATGQRREALGRKARIGAGQREEATARLADLDLNAAEARAQLAAIGDEIAAATIAAPMAGIVTGLAVTGPGTALRPGAPVLTLVAATAAPRAHAHLAPADRARVAPGQPVRVVPVSTGPDPGDFAGRVVDLGAVPVGTAQGGDQAYPVRVAFDIPPGQPPPGWGQPVRVIVPGPTDTLAGFFLAPLRRAMIPAPRPP